MLIQHCDKCGRKLAETVTGASIPRLSTMHGDLDLCDDCRESLYSLVWDWVKASAVEQESKAKRPQTVHLWKNKSISEVPEVTRPRPRPKRAKRRR